jgi:hypothetical protein
MPAKRRLKPFRQGELDSLCGALAIINAVRLSAAGLGRRISRRESADLFTNLVFAAEDAAGAATVICCGLRTRVLRKLLTAAAVHLEEELRLSMKTKRLVVPKERPSIRHFVSELRKSTMEEESAVVLGVTGHLEHWTVVKAVSDENLELFDSDRNERLKRSRCRMTYERPLSKRHEYVLSPNAAFRISVR